MGRPPGALQHMEAGWRVILRRKGWGTNTLGHKETSDDRKGGRGLELDGQALGERMDEGEVSRVTGRTFLS